MTIRQTNLIGQMRLDIPHLRAMESSISADFDALGGEMLAGQRPLVLSGLRVLTAGAISAPASNLVVTVAGALLMHWNATEAGSVFRIRSDQAQEQLQTSNPRVSGSWTSSAVNYVVLDLFRAADATTTDTVKFFDPDTRAEVARSVPLARTLDYRFVISTSPFSSQETVLPLAKVTLGSTGQVTAIVDSRELMFRRGRGGDQPSQAAYTWPQGRAEPLTSADPFTGGDRAPASLKDWMDAVMSRVQEIGGGASWYSPTADRNIIMVWTGAPFAGGENFEWDGTHLHWKGLTFLFDNSSNVTTGAAVTYNDVANQTGNSAGLTDLADGDCLYVDLDRTTAASLSAAKTSLALLGTGAVPGARQIVAWRKGSSVYTRNSRGAIGAATPVATTTTLGTVVLNQTPASALLPAVVTIMADGRIEVAATANDAAAATFRGQGTGAGVVGYSGTPTGAGYTYAQAGTLGYGSNGIVSGTVSRTRGRPGATGYGGTGAVGGHGGAHFGGAGNAAIDADAIGGAGDLAAGGDGVGVGLGGVGYWGLGGADGTATYRAPGFLAPIPVSGPNPDVAYKAEVGSMEISAGGDSFRYDGAKTGTIILGAADFIPGQGGPAEPVFLTGGLSGGGAIPVWTGNAGNATNLGATIRVPRGATITGVRLYTTNQHASNAYNITVTIKRMLHQGTGSAMAGAFVLNADVVSIPAMSADTWTATAAVTAQAAALGVGTASGAASFYWLTLTLASVAVISDLALQAVMIEYTFTKCDFMV